MDDDDRNFAHALLVIVLFWAVVGSVWLVSGALYGIFQDATEQVGGHGHD